MLRPHQRVRLSKVISRALRHAPESYGLTLDETDSVALSDLVAGLRKSSEDFAELDEMDIIELTLSAEKVRHEIDGDRIRALYGHSTEQRRVIAPTHPPTELFHGTSRRAVPQILEAGLKPMRRQYVHLSADVETARLVGRRKDAEPVILEIRARSAEQEGVEFFRVTEKIWLAREIAARFVRPI